MTEQEIDVYNRFHLGELYTELNEYIGTKLQWGFENFLGFDNGEHLNLHSNSFQDSLGILSKFTRDIQVRTNWSVIQDGKVTMQLYFDIDCKCGYCTNHADFTFVECTFNGERWNLHNPC